MAKFTFKVEVKYKYDKFTKTWTVTCYQYLLSAYGKTKKQAKKRFKAVLHYYLLEN